MAALPLPADSNALAFDRAAATLLPFAAIIEGTSTEHQQVIIRHIVERVTLSGREVVSIRVRPEARPFFDDYPAAVVMAPPDGSGARTNQQGRGLRRVRVMPRVVRYPDWRRLASSKTTTETDRHVTLAQERQAVEVLEAALVG